MGVTLKSTYASLTGWKGSCSFIKQVFLAHRDKQELQMPVRLRTEPASPLVATDRYGSVAGLVYTPGL